MLFLSLVCLAVVVLSLAPAAYARLRVEFDHRRNNYLRHGVCPTCGAGAIRRASRPKSRGKGYVPVYRCLECLNEFDVPLHHIHARRRATYSERVDTEATAFLEEDGAPRYDS